MFYNTSTGIFNLIADFPKLISIKGEYKTVNYMFKNNNTGTYILNLLMPELIEISETTTSTSYTLC